MEISNMATIPSSSLEEGRLQALSPTVQEKREKEAILRDPRFIEWLGNAEILEIRKIEGRKDPSYLILTPSDELRVDVFYLPDHRIGPVPFELVFYFPERSN